MKIGIPKFIFAREVLFQAMEQQEKKKQHWNLLLGDGRMRTLSKNIKKWLRIFITLDIFYEEIRSFLGILLNCTSLFYVKSFCCWCPIISPIYSAMYVSNVWMRHCVILQNGKFSYYDIGSKVDVQSLHNLCIQKNQHSTFGKSLKNDSTQLSISSKWISLNVI